MALLLDLQPALITKVAGGARESDGAALRTEVCLRASHRLHPLRTTAAGEAGGAKSRASGTGLLTRVGAIAATYAGRADKRVVKVVRPKW